MPQNNDYWVTEFRNGEPFRFKYEEYRSQREGCDCYESLALDFSNFDGIQNHTSGKLKQVVDTTRRQWRTQNPSLSEEEIERDFLFFLCDLVGKSAHELFGIDYQTNRSGKLEEMFDQRRKRKHSIYRNSSEIHLSDLQGAATCMELGIMGQYLLQSNLWKPYKSSYVAVHYLDEDRLVELAPPHVHLPTPHAAILINDEEHRVSHIFDIAQFGLDDTLEYPTPTFYKIGVFLSEEILSQVSESTILRFPGSLLGNNEKRMFWMLPSKIEGNWWDGIIGLQGGVRYRELDLS